MEKRILILEDEIIVALDLQEILDHAGYTTLVKHNYADAIESKKSSNHTWQYVISI